MPTKPSRLDSLAGYLVALVVAVVSLAACGLEQATAGTICRSSICRQQVAYSAPAKVAYPVSYYTVAPQLAQQSTDTYGFRQSAEWVEYQQLKGYQLATRELAQTLAAQRPSPQLEAQWQDAPLPELAVAPGANPSPPASGGSREVLETPQPQAPSAEYGGNLPRVGELSAPPMAPPAAQPPAAPSAPGPQPDRAPGAVDPSWIAFESRYPTIAASCSSCHGKNDPLEPAGGLDLAGAEPLDGDDGGAPQRRDAIIRMIWRGHMPPQKPASDETIAAILAELYNEAPAQ